jgi:hypothetical protein
MDEADKASMRIYEHLQVSSITWMLHTEIVGLRKK